MAEEHKKHDDHGEHGGESHGGGGHGGGHGGGAHEEHEGAPEWLVSFADNVMLQMGFFVILLAMNMGPKGGGGDGPPSEGEGEPTTAMIDFALGLREAFNNPVDPDDPNENPQFVKRLKELRGEGDFSGPQGDKPTQQSLRESNFVNIGAKIAFEDNSTKLTQAARETMAQTAEKLRGLRFYIEIRGHCSPSESMRDPLRAMKLSYDRAAAAAATLVEYGVKWEQLRIMAYGDNDRLVSRTYSRENDRNNQRVEVVVTTQTLPGDPYAVQQGGEEK
jgi:flagellar motor protein MotB